MQLVKKKRAHIIVLPPELDEQLDGALKPAANQASTGNRTALVVQEKESFEHVQSDYRHSWCRHIKILSAFHKVKGNDIY